MVNAHHKGARAENDVITYLRLLNYEGERLRLAGVHDRGDIWIPSERMRLEIKNHLLKNLPGTMAELTVDLEKLRKLFPNDLNLGVIARPAKPVGEWWVVRQMKDYFGDPRTLV